MFGCIGCRRTKKNKPTTRNNLKSTLKKKNEYNSLSYYNKNIYERETLSTAYNNLILAIEDATVPQSKINYITELLTILVPQYGNVLQRNIIQYAKLRQYLKLWKVEFPTNESFQSLIQKSEIYLDSLNMNLKDKLIDSIKSNNIETVHLLINAGADPNNGEIYYTPLIAAIDSNNRDIVELLLEKGADPNKGDSYQSPLVLAVRRNNRDVVELLLEKGANPDEKGIYHTVLTLAIMGKNRDIFELLLDKGANLNKENENAESLLSLAVKYNSRDIVELLLDKGRDPNKQDKFGTNPINIAINNNNYDIVELLLDKGADVNKEINLYTPIIYAIRKNNRDIVELLLNKGADPNKQNNLGTTPITSAMDNNNRDIVELLLNKGADPNQSSLLGTPLMYAIYKNNRDIVELLLEKGAEPNEENEFSSPIITAIHNDNYEIVELLLNKGVNVNIISKIYLSGKLIQVTPLIYSSKISEDITRLLLDHNADVNQKLPINGYTPLHYAAYYDKDTIVKLLLERGADKTIVGNDGNKPIDVAKSATVKYLLSDTINVPNPSGTIEISERNEGDEELNIMSFPIEEGNTLAFLKPGFSDQRVVVKKKDGEETDGWKWLVGKKKNPMTNEAINLNSLNYKTVVMVSKQKMEGGLRTRNQRRNKKQKRSLRQRK